MLFIYTFIFKHDIPLKLTFAKPFGGFGKGIWENASGF